MVTLEAESAKNYDTKFMWQTHPLTMFMWHSDLGVSLKNFLFIVLLLSCGF